MWALEYLPARVCTGTVGGDARGRPSKGMPGAVTHPKEAAAWLSVPILILTGRVAQGKALPPRLRTLASSSVNRGQPCWPAEAELGWEEPGDWDARARRLPRVQHLRDAPGGDDAGGQSRGAASALPPWARSGLLGAPLLTGLLTPNPSTEEQPAPSPKAHWITTHPAATVNPGLPGH